jgi:branched-subunit amino acid aminotransferase/4-amino-4-deoxychorismate lyase
MMLLQTGGGTFTGVIFNAAGVVTVTDATSAGLAGLTRAGVIAYAATNGWKCWTVQ